MKVALLGAESTGKTALAQGLASHWRSQGHAVHEVGEYLREWCAREGRTPRPDEQWAIAQEQARRALQAPPGHWLVADTSPLMIAVYSDLLFDDTSLYEFAQAHQHHYDLTLLTGLDLPWVADGLQRDGPHVREPVDARVRAALQRSGVAYRMVYGQGAQRLTNAVLALNARTGELDPARAQLQSRPWTCDKCSDPDCEHRLFSRLGLTDRRV
ncbi:MAG: AAA family ATPase [Ramlibacter sp.]